jgi:hypothetical protein
MGAGHGLGIGKGTPFCTEGGRNGGRGPGPVISIVPAPAVIKKLGRQGAGGKHGGRKRLPVLMVQFMMSAAMWRVLAGPK